jgi:uncharacterized protein YaiL (DUF2058 family)
VHHDHLPEQRRWPAAALAATLLVLAGCATTAPPPTAQLDAARTAIATAERTDAGRYAGAELAEARDKLARAETAVTAEDMLRASQLADESRVEAELAAARTEANKAATVNRELSEGTEALTDEMQRAGDQR